jgi:hypothetical protein
MESGKKTGKLDPSKLGLFGPFIDHLTKGGGGTKPPKTTGTPPPPTRIAPPRPTTDTPPPPPQTTGTPPPPKRMAPPTPQTTVSPPPPTTDKPPTPPPPTDTGPPPTTNKPPTPPLTTPSTPPLPPIRTPSDARKAIKNADPTALARLSFESQVHLLGPVSGAVKDAKQELAQLKAQIPNLSGTPKSEAERRKTELEQQIKENQEACNKLYRVLPLDRDFQAKDRQQRQQYLNVLARDSNLQTLADPGSWEVNTPETKVACLQEAVKKQYEVLCPGKTPPTIVMKRWPADASPEKRQAVTQGGTKPQGHYSPGDHSITLWVYKPPGAEEEGPLSSFGEAIDTAIHETSHAHQHEMIRAVESGALRPPPSAENWQYAQAKLFQLNQDAYEDGGLDRQAYLNEPMEKHAWLAGGTASMLFNFDARAIELRAKLDKAAGRFPDKKGTYDTMWDALQGDKTLAEKAAAFLEAAEEIDRALDEVNTQQLKEQPEFLLAKQAVEEVIKGLPKFYAGSPPLAQKTLLGTKYQQIIDLWNKGAAVNIPKCKGLMVTLKERYQELGVAARAYADYSEALGRMIDASNALPNPLPTGLFSLYQRLREVQKTTEEQFTTASTELDAGKMNTLTAQINKLCEGYGTLKKRTETE